jgi:site-specific DNA-adenine methylase
MPFAYYGAKHGLARSYPPPAFGTIIEPFAGAAGYSVFWATPQHTVKLFDKDERVVDLWRDLMFDTAGLVSELDTQIKTGVVRHPILTIMRGGTTERLSGRRSEKVNDWLIGNWSSVRRRILKVAPLIAGWTIQQCDYRDIPNERATWFIDPPYQPFLTDAGSLYREGSDGIRYDELSTWSQSRTGQVIVCEQEPAKWLPFRPLKRQNAQATNTSGRGSQARTEVVWTRTPGHAINTKTAKRATERAKARRNT